MLKQKHTILCHKSAVSLASLIFHCQSSQYITFPKIDPSNASFEVCTGSYIISRVFTVTPFVLHVLYILSLYNVAQSAHLQWKKTNKFWKRNITTESKYCAFFNLSDLKSYYEWFFYSKTIGASAQTLQSQRIYIQNILLLCINPRNKPFNRLFTGSLCVPNTPYSLLYICKLNEQTSILLVMVRS